MRIGRAIFCALVFLSAIVHDSSGTAHAQRQSFVVKMTDAYRYFPPSITVEVGDTVEWVNLSEELVGHTVTADPGEARDPSHVSLPPGAEPFDSGVLPPGTSFRHTFVVPGRYIYFCVSHEMQEMIGEVLVEQ